jgi:hypothetical protein
MNHKSSFGFAFAFSEHMDRHRRAAIRSQFKAILCVRRHGNGQSLRQETQKSISCEA